jgi:hypothetical protein
MHNPEEGEMCIYIVWLRPSTILFLSRGAKGTCIVAFAVMAKNCEEENTVNNMMFMTEIHPIYLRYLSCIRMKHHI